MAETICAVALDAATYAIDKLYSYRVPDELREQVQIGTRVLVPFGFGNKRAEAVVLAFREDAGEFKLKPIVEVLDEKPAITDDAAKADAAVEDGGIDFDHVSFKYNDQSPEWILKDVNLHIPSGATVGILGGTGSGKTTLVSLIPRLYEAQEGTVSVGGRPVADYTMEHLRESVSVVLQKNTLFSGTIRENLLWGDPNATEEQLWKACRAACAACSSVWCAS